MLLEAQSAVLAARRVSDERVEAVTLEVRGQAPVGWAAASTTPATRRMTPGDSERRGFVVWTVSAEGLPEQEALDADVRHKLAGGLVLRCAAWLPGADRALVQAVRSACSGLKVEIRAEEGPGHAEE